MGVSVTRDMIDDHGCDAMRYFVAMVDDVAHVVDKVGAW